MPGMMRPAQRGAATKGKTARNAKAGAKLSAKRSKTGDPVCSEAMSAWKTNGMTPQIAATLGRCRSMVRQRKAPQATRPSVRDQADAHRAGKGDRRQRAIERAQKAHERLRDGGAKWGDAKYNRALDRAIALKASAERGTSYKSEARRHADRLHRLHQAKDERQGRLALKPGPKRAPEPPPRAERGTADRRKAAQRLQEARQRLQEARKPTEPAKPARGSEERRRTAQRLKAARHQATAASKAKPTGTAEHGPGWLGEVDASTVHFDPTRFQYKLAQTDHSTGAVGSLAGVKKWDPELAGVVSVWRDPADGKTYVVNGHNRLDLAKKLGVDRVAVRYLRADDHVMARAKGALANIAEGRGTSTDAAKFFRDLGDATGRPIGREDLVSRGIPLTEAKTTEGLGLAQLNKPLFAKIINGELPVSKGAIIGGGGAHRPAAKERA